MVRMKTAALNLQNEHFLFYWEAICLLETAQLDGHSAKLSSLDTYKGTKLWLIASVKENGPVSKFH